MQSDPRDFDALIDTVAWQMTGGDVDLRTRVMGRLDAAHASRTHARRRMLVAAAAALALIAAAAIAVRAPGPPPPPTAGTGRDAARPSAPPAPPPPSALTARRTERTDNRVSATRVAPGGERVARAAAGKRRALAPLDPALRFDSEHTPSPLVIPALDMLPIDEPTPVSAPPLDAAHIAVPPIDKGEPR